MIIDVKETTGLEFLDQGLDGCDVRFVEDAARDARERVALGAL